MSLSLLQRGACRILPHGMMVVALASQAVPSAEPPIWENPAVFRINKEAPHATKMPFPDAGAHWRSRATPAPGTAA